MAKPLAFPLDSETFFVKDPVARTGAVEEAAA